MTQEKLVVLRDGHERNEGHGNRVIFLRKYYYRENKITTVLLITFIQYQKPTSTLWINTHTKND